MSEVIATYIYLYIFILTLLIHSNFSRPLLNQTYTFSHHCNGYKWVDILLY